MCSYIYKISYLKTIYLIVLYMAGVLFAGIKTPCYLLLTISVNPSNSLQSKTTIRVGRILYRAHFMANRHALLQISGFKSMIQLKKNIISCNFNMYSRSKISLEFTKLPDSHYLSITLVQCIVSGCSQGIT